MNLKEGAGEYRTKDGDLIKGNFLQNKAHGLCIIHYADGGHYEGTLVYGKKDGEGCFKDEINQIIYEG
jgi:hypothetical protein